MCDIRTKCINLHKEYSDVLQVPDNGNVLEEFVIRDVAKNLVVTTEVFESWNCKYETFFYEYYRNMLVLKLKLNN
jgi:hypothetical protein